MNYGFKNCQVNIIEKEHKFLKNFKKSINYC